MLTDEQKQEIKDGYYDTLEQNIKNYVFDNRDLKVLLLHYEQKCSDYKNLVEEVECKLEVINSLLNEKEGV